MKTAVEWLIEELIEGGDIKQNWRSMQSIEKAIAMEKQQVIDAYHINPSETRWKNIGENYYNETFKK